jgi:hypothetical protein
MRSTIARLAAVAAASLLLTACATSTSGSGTLSAGGGTAEASPDPTDSTSSPSSPVPTSKPASSAPAAKQEIQVEAGFSSRPAGQYSSGPDVTAAAVLTNPSTKAACSVRAVFNALDAAGTTVKTETADIDWIPAGGRAFAVPLVFTPSVEPASVTVTVVVEEFRSAKDLSQCKGYYITDGIELPVSGAAIERSSSYFQKITGQVANPTSKLIDMAQITCILRADGSLVGGENTYLSDPIVPGGTVAFSMTSFSFIPDSANGVECQAIA